MLISTIFKQWEGVTLREVREAMLARTVQSQVSYPTDRKYRHMVNINSLENTLYNLSTSLRPNMPLVHYLQE